jgi:hemoglobin
MIALKKDIIFNLSKLICINKKKKGITVMYSLIKKHSILFAIVLTMIISVTTSYAQEQKEKSLYDRLGGVYAIATVVDDFIERLFVNDILNANPAIKEARERVPKAGLKYRVTELVCQVTGGPQKYTGRSMKDAHKHLNITEKEWDAMAADFKKTLDKFKVPEKEQKELFDIVGTTKADIVMIK